MSLLVIRKATMATWVALICGLVALCAAARILHRINEIDSTQYHILRKIGHTMALVQIEQETLDSIGEELSTVADEIQDLIDDPDVPLPDASVEKITTALGKLEALVPSTPVEPPVEEPAPEEPAPSE